MHRWGGESAPGLTRPRALVPHARARAGEKEDSGAYIAAPWTCTYAIYGCANPAADKYASYVTESKNSMCEYGGCNDTSATNFAQTAKYNDGTCIYARVGCMVSYAPPPVRFPPWVLLPR